MHGGIGAHERMENNNTNENEIESKEEEQMTNKKRKESQSDTWITRSYGESSATFYIPKIKVPKIEVPKLKNSFIFDERERRRKRR